jgi:hypothetical protein
MKEMSRSDANTIFGSTFDENLNGKIRVSVVATGIDDVLAKLPNKSDENKTVQNDKEQKLAKSTNSNQVDIFGEYNYNNEVKLSLSSNFTKVEEVKISKEYSSVDEHNIQNHKNIESDIYEIPAFLRRKKYGL